MPDARSSKRKLPKGVTELARDRGGRKFRAAIRCKGVEVHLGLYSTAWQAAFAFNVASSSIGRSRLPPNELPLTQRLTAEEVMAITSRVERRLGMRSVGAERRQRPPSHDELVTFFEVTVIGFWRAQAVIGQSAHAIDAAAGQLVNAAELLFWDTEPELQSATAVLHVCATRRISSVFRDQELMREILNDDGDELWRVARWLVLPDHSPVSRGFEEEVRYLYPDFFEDQGRRVGGWAEVLGLAPPFSLRQVREAYRRLSKSVHPDVGGSHREFLRLTEAYEQALIFVRHQAAEK